MGERIMVIPKWSAGEIGRGFKQASAETLTKLIAHIKAMPRDEVEENEEFLQVIPYAVIRRLKPGGNHEVLVYKRSDSGDQRLHGKLSIGFGGHWKEGEQTTTQALLRELNEELGITKNDIHEITVIGTLRSDEKPVDRVHIGVVFFVTVNRDCQPKPNNEISYLAWRNQYDLEELAKTDHMETWSRLIVEELIRVGWKW